MSEPVVKLENISKKYIKYEKRFITKELLRRLRGKQYTPKEFWALKNISLEIFKGESVGIIGENGSGKSTLLKILSNVTEPTTGTKVIRGNIASLLELGAGFHPYLTGRENIYLNGTILGMKKAHIDHIFKDIVDFSGVEDFIDTPVQNYSSGMYVRLGFSIAIHLNPDILIIDEVLAVGDEEFQRKCKTFIKEFHKKKKTLIVVSHDLSLVRDLCERVYWLKSGEIKMQGSIDLITSKYLAYIGEKEGLLSMSQGRTSLIFENGKIILFWRGIEITKNCCVFTYLMSVSQWHGSMLQKWRILKSNDNSFIAEGDWLLIPIRQRWEIQLLNEHEIIWKVTTIVKGDVHIKNDAINVMLTDHYKKWKTPRETDYFPPEFHHFGQRIIGLSQKEGCIGVVGMQLDDNMHLPALDFMILEPKGEYLSQVTNTDNQLRSRTLQFSRIQDTDLYKKGETHTFVGRIVIYENSDEE